MRLFNFIPEFREQQQRVFGEQKIDLRAGILVGQKHASDDFRSIDDLRRAAADAPPESLVVVTHLDDQSELIDLAGEAGDADIQLHNNCPSPERVEALKSEYPDRTFWHVVHSPQESNPLRQGAAERDAIAIAHELVAADIDILVVDAFNMDTGQMGGTGMPVSPRFAKRLQASFKNSDKQTRIVLAGGLTYGNVADKITDLQPGGVDANTGLNSARLGRHKDMRKVRGFCSESLRGVYGDATADLWLERTYA